MAMPRGRPRKYPLQEDQREPHAIKVEPDDDMANALEPEPLPYVPHPSLRAQQEIQQQKAEIRTKEAAGRDYEPTSGLECPSCKSLFIETQDTKRKMGIVRRRRICQKCNRAWYTVEMPESELQNREES